VHLRPVPQRGRERRASARLVRAGAGDRPAGFHRLHPLSDPRPIGRAGDALLVGGAHADPGRHRPGRLHRPEHRRRDRAAPAEGHRLRPLAARLGRPAAAAGQGGAGGQRQPARRNQPAPRPDHAGARLHGGADRAGADLPAGQFGLSAAHRSPPGDRPYRRRGPAGGARPGFRRTTVRSDGQRRALHRPRHGRMASAHAGRCARAALRGLHLPADPERRGPGHRRVRRRLRRHRPGARRGPAEAAGRRAESPGEEHPGHRPVDRRPDAAGAPRPGGLPREVRGAADGAVGHPRPAHRLELAQRLAERRVAGRAASPRRGPLRAGRRGRRTGPRRGADAGPGVPRAGHQRGQVRGPVGRGPRGWL
jgi:hypothetical protein